LYNQSRQVNWNYRNLEPARTHTAPRHGNQFLSEGIKKEEKMLK